MSMESLPDASTIPDYVQSGDFAPDSEDSELIEGPSRISLKCPISRTRIKTPVKGQSCKHLQCFDFNNYVDINTRRPSWRCPHCNQHVRYTNIRIDQNMAKVLKEVAEDVADVIISADGSWKAVMENDDDVDKMHDKTLNGQKDGSEQPESATGVLDLTQADTEVDAMEIVETEDMKPSLANLQSLSASANLTAGTNQNVAPPLEDNFWTELFLSTGGSVTSTSRTDTQVGGRSESTPNLTVSPVFSDAISPASIRTDARGNANPTTPGIQNNPAAAANNLHPTTPGIQNPAAAANNLHPTTPGIQNPVAAANNLHLRPLQMINSMSSPEYANLQNMPRHVNRTTAAVQALPAASPTQIQTPTQQGLRNSMNTMGSNSSSRTPHQSRSQQERTFGQQVGVAAPNQLAGSYRPPGFLSEYQNPHLQQALNMRSQPRSPSPGLMRSPSPMLRAQAQQGAAQVGVAYTAGNMSSNPTRFMAASQRTTQMARPPMVAVQTQTPRAPTVEQRLNMGGSATAASRADTSADLASEQNWRPTGRMRGSLTGRAYNEALNQMMIQPTQSTQASRPQTSLTSPPSVPPHVPAPHVQAFLASSRNPVSPKVTETSGTNGNSGNLPERSSGMN